jgi:hypothetical protein
MAKLQEYFFRSLFACMLSVLAAPIAGVLVLAFTGLSVSDHFAVGMFALTAAALFFTPWVKEGAADHVKSIRND